MMPGETPPVAAAAGLAAEAATACANCGALQQNLNEYVAALIALKQKIIDTDHLLTDYEQKCNELKCAERENHTLRQQVEQMLQKLSPLEKCQEELGSVQAELEEKKSSLKIYQDTHQEYFRVKEEMGKSDAMKKKLEAKVKKLEKATEKHSQDFRQLKAEKKVLEKELKKAQEKTEDFPKEKRKKVVRHVETQSERGWPVANLDKEKIKLLLKELWLCIDHSTGKNTDENDCYLADVHNNSRARGKTKAVHNPPKLKRARGERPSHCPSPETCTTQTSLTSLQIKLGSSPGQMESEATETSPACIGDGAPYQGRPPRLTIQTDPSGSNPDLFSKEPEEAGEDLIEVWKWVRPLPPLLSPIQCSPATTPITLVEELTESSDEEMDQNAQKLESMVEGPDESTSEAHAMSKKYPKELLREYDSFDVNNKSSDPCELSGRPTASKHNSSVLYSGPLAKSGFLHKIRAKAKDGEKQLEQNCEFIEGNTEISVHSIKSIAQKTADVTQTESKTLVCDLMSGNCFQGQEKSVEPGHALEVVTSSIEQALNESTDLIKKEKQGKLTRTAEASISCLVEEHQPPSHEGSSPQHTEESVLATENVPGVPGKGDSSDVIGAAVTEEDIQTESDFGRGRPLPEHNSPEQNTTEESGTWCNGELEFIDGRMNLYPVKLHSKTNRHIDQAQDEQTEVMLAQAVEKDVQASGASIKLFWAQNSYSNKDGSHDDSKCDVNKKTELGSVDALRSEVHNTQAVDGGENSFSRSDEVIQIKNKCSDAPCASQNAEGDVPKIEVENIKGQDKTVESVLEETPSPIVTEGGLQLQGWVDQKGSSGLLQEEPPSMNSPVLPTQVSVVKDGLSRPVGLVQARPASSQLETVAGNASELEQFEDPGDKLKHVPVIHSANSIPSVEPIMEGRCLTSGRLGGDSDGPLKTAATVITELVSAMERAERTTSGVVFERPAQFCLVTGNSLKDAPSQEMTKRNDKSRSPKPRKSSVEDMEMDECSVANEAAVEVNLNGSSAPSAQEAPQAENAAPGAAGPVPLAVRSESSTALFFARSGSGCNAAANGQSSDPPFSSPSTRVDPIDLCNSREHLMDKEVDAEHAGGNQHKSLDDCSRNDQDEVEIKRAGEQSASSETQAQVHVEGCCDGNDSGEYFEAPCPSTASPWPTSVANQSILSRDQGLVTTSREKTGSPSRSCSVEHPLNEAMFKETDETLSTGVKSIEVETPDDAVATAHVSASSSPEEYPLKKVNPPNKRSRLLSFKEELDTVRSSQADVPSSPIVPYGVHELPCLTEDASPKDKQSHNGDSYAPKAVANAWEHSYAAPYSSEKGSSILEALGSVEQEAGKSVARTKRGEVDSGEPASGRWSACDLEVNGDALSPEAEPRCLSAEPSAASPAASAKQERTSADSEWNSDVAQNHLTDRHVDGDTDAAFKKGSHLDKESDILAALASEDSIPVNSESPSAGKQEVLSQESELLVKSPKQNGAQQTQQQSEFSNLSAKARAEGGSGRPLPCIPSRKGRRKSRQSLLAETIIANTDTSTSMKCSPKSLEKIRREVGAPLPPLLLPLVATPPRTAEPVSPAMSSTSQLPLLSPLSALISPLRKTPIAPPTSLLSDLPKHKLPALQTTPSPSKTTTGEKTLSSPLQFCAVTPKHALPVPGRFPPSAAASATPVVSQENSVKILDSMYPELSARAITLNILKGNIQLGRSSSRGSKNTPPPVRQISSFKDIASSSTAFVKTGSTLFSELSSSTVSEAGKRTLAPPAMPKSAKRLRLDSELLKADLSKEEPSPRDLVAGTQGPAGEAAGLTSGDAVQSIGSSSLILPVEETDPESRAVTVALEKISKSCFDLLPVIHSRVYAGNKSNIPIMTDPEKEVVYEFGVAKKGLAEPALQTIRNKLKHQKMSLDPSHIQSLCRVYVGICRQLGDLEKARLFCYSLLKEGFPQPGKLILFMGNMWSDIFTSKEVINRAVQLVARKCSTGQVLEYLETFLNWEESEPVDIGIMISSLLLAIQRCPQMEFQMSEQRGEDLKESLWEYVFAIDLLCSHQKWGWTHDHVISKELWPIMDKWIKNRKRSGSASSPSDVIVATVLRLIGRLSQIGLKEGFSSTVKNISSVIGDFLRHAKEQDVPWGVQLAAVYALCELGPSSPSEILEAIGAWETVNRNRLPPAVSTDIAEVSRLLKP